MEDRNSEHPLPDRRTVLSGASAAALGVSALMLPAAAAAVSLGGQGGSGTFGVRDTTSYSTVGATSDTVVFRSFTYGTNRYFCDLVNGKLIVFGASGTLVETVNIPSAATLLVGFGDANNSDSSSLSARQLTSFVVVGDAAYVAYLLSDSNDTNFLRVVRLTLSISSGLTTVTTASKDLDLDASFGNARIPTLEAGDDGSLNPEWLSALANVSSTALHCLLTSFVSFFDASEDAESSTNYLDRIVVPIGTAWGDPITNTKLAEDEFFLFSLSGAVAIPPANPTHALFFDTDNSEGVLVPLTGTTWTRLSFGVDAEIAETISSPAFYGGVDTWTRIEGSTLYAAGEVSVSGSSRTAVLAFDVSAVPSTTLVATAAAVVPDLPARYPAALTGQGSTLYLAFQFGFNSPGQADYQVEGYVAKFQTDSLGWVATATVGLNATPPWHFPMTAQAVTAGVVTGGQGGTTVDAVGQTSSPLLVLVGDAA
jgi:hypothetical protein